MAYLNAQTKNIGNDEGDVYKFFQSKMRNLIQYNGGDHSFNWFTEDVDDKTAPMPVGTKTKIKWTHKGHTISQMEKNFATLRLEFVAQLNKVLDLSADKNNLMKLMIGFKHAVEIFRYARLWIDEVMLKEYQQDELIRESFAYNSIRPRDAKATSKNRFTTWENSSQMSPSICGDYYDMTVLADGKPHTLAFELTIYFTDQLAFQAWQLYPNSLIGEIEEEVSTALDAMVWHQVNPNVVKEVKQFLNDTVINEEIPAVVPITRKFTQVGSPATIVSVYKEGASNDILDGHIKVPNGTDNGIDMKCEEAILNIRGGTITVMRSDLAGFGIKPDCLAGLQRELQTPLLIPSQQLVREAFQGNVSPAGIDVSKSITLNNATNITVMFPKRTNEITCYDNIMYQNVQLTINNIKYPDTEFENTVCPRFYQYQLIANELDGTLEATQEFEDSFTQPLNDLQTGKRNANCRSDGTSFGINFQLERSNAGYVFDGVSTGSNSITVKFKGQPMFRGDDDTYYNFDVNDKQSHPQPPEMWICTDTYFTWSISDKVKYFSDNVPAGLD